MAKMGRGGNKGKGGHKGPKGGSKRKISSVKRDNQKRNKLVKQGKAKPNSKPRYIPNQKKVPDKIDRPVYKPTPEDLKEREEARKRDEEAMYDELANSLSAKEKSYLAKTAKKRKRGSDEEDDSDDGGIEEHELAALQRISSQQTQEKKVRSLLPIKTKDGLKMRNIEVSDSEEENQEEEEENDAEGKSEKIEGDEDKDSGVEEDQPLQGQELSVVEVYAQRKVLLGEKKLHIGNLASNFLEMPEERMINLEKLVKMVDSEQQKPIEISVHRLAAASVLEILKDVTPGYKINHHQDDRMLKKETLKLQKFEQGLLRCYKNYLVKLEKLVNTLKGRKPAGKDPINEKQAEFFLSCMCQLLVAHPHFNFAANILHAVVPLLTCANTTARDTVRRAIQDVFRGDMRGEISLEAVKLINHLVKSRKHNVRNDVIDVLLSLRIKNVNLDKEKEDEIELKKKEARKKKLMEKNHISRQEKKRKKKMAALERELLEAKGEEGRQVKEKFFTECTKLVFTIYFRILKSFPRSKLMGSVLEGLSKFAHVINIQFFSDLITAFKSLLAADFLSHRDRLLVVSTVFTILSGQGEALNIDPASFYLNIYSSLLEIDGVRNHTDIPLVTRTLHDMLIKRKKKVSRGRVLAFTKRVATMALQQVHGGCLANLSTLRQLQLTHTFVNQLLDSEHEVGSGVFNPTVEDPEHACASNTTAWELSLLSRHYHAHVASMSAHVAAQCPPTGQLALSQDLKKPGEEIFNDYSMEDMGFKPSIPPPPSKKAAKRAGGALAASSLASLQPQHVLDSVKCDAAGLDFYSAAVASVSTS